MQKLVDVPQVAIVPGKAQVNAPAGVLEAAVTAGIGPERLVEIGNRGPAGRIAEVAVPVVQVAQHRQDYVVVGVHLIFRQQGGWRSVQEFLIVTAPAYREQNRHEQVGYLFHIDLFMRGFVDLIDAMRHFHFSTPHFPLNR